MVTVKSTKMLDIFLLQGLNSWYKYYNHTLIESWVVHEKMPHCKNAYTDTLIDTSIIAIINIS